MAGRFITERSGIKTHLCSHTRAIECPQPLSDVVVVPFRDAIVKSLIRRHIDMATLFHRPNAWPYEVHPTDVHCQRFHWPSIHSYQPPISCGCAAHRRIIGWPHSKCGILTDDFYQNPIFTGREEETVIIIGRNLWDFSFSFFFCNFVEAMIRWRSGQENKKDFV